MHSKEWTKYVRNVTRKGLWDEGPQQHAMVDYAK